MTNQSKSATGAKVTAWFGAALMVAAVAIFIWTASQGMNESTASGMYNLMFFFLAIAVVAVGFVMLAAGLIFQALRKD